MPRSKPGPDHEAEVVDELMGVNPFREDDWVPNVGEDGVSRQALFYNDDKHKFQLVMGGAGSGKTTIAIRKFIKIMQDQPGIVGLITRTTGPALRSITFNDFIMVCPPEFIKENGITMYPNPIIKFRNGSIAHFVAYDGKEAEKIRSMNLGVIWMEEATLFKESTYWEFDRRLRQTQGVEFDEEGKPRKALIGRRYLILTTNPNGRDWVWKEFIRDAASKAETHAHWIMPSTDNRLALPEDFFDSAKRLPKEYYEKFILGQVNEMAGCVYPTFDRSIHVIDTEGWMPKQWWPVFVGMDYGYKTPCTAIWMAFDERGNCIVFREYGRRMGTPKVNAYAIKTQTSMMISQGMGEPAMFVIDPSTKAHKGESEEGKSVFDMLTEEGLPLTPGSRDLMGRILKLAMRLQPDPAVKIHPVTGAIREEGWPSIFFTRDCPCLIDELETWQWKEIRDPSIEREMPEERNDHYHDGLSYALAESCIEAGPDPAFDVAYRGTDAYRLEKYRESISRSKRGHGRLGVY